MQLPPLKFITLSPVDLCILNLCTLKSEPISNLKDVKTNFMLGLIAKILCPTTSIHIKKNQLTSLKVIFARAVFNYCKSLFN